MLKIITIVLLNLLLQSSICIEDGQAGQVSFPPPEPNITVVPPATTTPSIPTLKPITTPAPSPSPTTPSTTKPTTPSTAKPTTPSTPKPTTPTPATSTVAPTTATTTNPNTTTPQPSPKPGTWEVRVNGTGDSSCIVLKMYAVIDVNYTTTANKVEEAQLIIPSDATALGNCGDSEQNITLTWSPIFNVTNTVEFVFKKDSGKFDLECIKANLTRDSKNFPGAKDANKSVELTHEKKDFVTPLKMSYKCTKLQELQLNDSNAPMGSIKISDVQWQAFGEITNDKFAEAKDCEPYETPDIVPIAVGCALMALIIIVLIGYLIGRRRNQARGYLSM